MSEITRLLALAADGDAEAFHELVPLIYHDLHQMAAARVARERSDHSLQATGLVHEAYIRLVGGENPAHFRNRYHFFATAAEAMRRILVETARRKAAAKRGGHRERVELDHLEVAAVEGAELLELHDALVEFERIEPAKASLVKLRYFAGLTIEEAAEMLDISPATAKRYWAFSRAWLFAALTERDPEAEKIPGG